MYVYDGTSFRTYEPMVWTGTAWKRPFVSYFNGTWEPRAVIGQSISNSVTLSYSVPSPTPLTKTYVATTSFGTTWAQTYRGNNSQRTDNSYLYQGYSVASNGNMKSLIGFNVSVPAGSVCLEASLSLYANHWYWNSGGEAIIGTHTNASKPGTYNAANSWTDRVRHSWNTKTGQRTINLGTQVGQSLIDGQHKGIVIGPGLSTSSTYYGYFTSTGGYAPVLTLRYQYVA